jgi:hypothetical protein
MIGPISTRLLPERWREDAFIAGGYAACPELATDIDVWVPVPEENSLSDVRSELLAWLGLQRLEYRAAVERTIDANVELGYSLRVGGIVYLDNRTVATVFGTMENRYPRPYHLIVTNGDVDDVLEGFDISTHQIAYTSKGVVKGSGWTPLHEQPVVLKDTPHTQNRLAKISQRYAHIRAEYAATLLMAVGDGWGV